MNRIAIVGHPASGYEEVLALLQQSGMAAARPSRRDGLLPQDINATVMAAHKAPLVSDVFHEDEFAPIDTGPVWHGMALDLMLGNLDEPLWGWADPQAIYALGYWKDLDPHLTFVLVYDEPHRVLMDASRSRSRPSSTEDLHRLLDNWTAYNGALLRFFLRHPTRCVLVHAQQACRSAHTYLQRLQPLLDARLSLPEAAAQSDGKALLPGRAQSSLPTVVRQAVEAAGAEPQQAAELLSARAAERYLIDGVLAGHRRALQLYAELQSAASLPLERLAHDVGSADFGWEALIAQRNFAANLLERLHLKYEGARNELGEVCARVDNAHAALAREKDQLTQQLCQLQKALDIEKTKIKQQQQERVNASVEYETRIRELSAENELLVTQLHEVQEELERVLLSKRELEERAEKSAAKQKAAAERAKHRINELVQRLKSANQRINREIEEAQRVRQHIAYRLGQVLLEHGRTPWGCLILPFALIRVAREYRQRQRTLG